MFRTERIQRPLAIAMAFLLCFTMMPMPAFATEANGENSADTSSTATPPTFDPSDTPTPASAEDESNNDGTENNDLASSGDQEEITIDDDSSDFIGEGETPDEPSSETVAKAAKLPAARAQINVVVPTVFNFGGDSGYNIDLGTPEEGYLSSTGMFLNKGTGIAQIASVKCSYPKINGVDVPASEYALTNVEDKKIFGLIDSTMGAELRFGVSEGVNEADTSGLKEGASYGMVSNVGNLFECRLYLDGVSFNANVADGLTLQPLANVIFTVQALSDNGTIDKDTPDSSLEDGSLPFYLKTFNTDGSVKAIYSAGEVKLHAKSIAAEGTSSPYYERYKAYIDADIAACKKNYDENLGKNFFKDREGNIIYKADGVTPEDDINVVKSTHAQDGNTFTQDINCCNVLATSNDTYLCKANLNNEGYKRVRIIGIQADSIASSGNKTGLTFETIDTFQSRDKSQDTFWANWSNEQGQFHVWKSPLFERWNLSIGAVGDGSQSQSYYTVPSTVVDSWVDPKFPYCEKVTTRDGLPAYFFMLGAPDIVINDDQSGRYYFYQTLLEYNEKIFVSVGESTRYSYSNFLGWENRGTTSFSSPRILASWLYSNYWDYIDGPTGTIHYKQPPYNSVNGFEGDESFAQINYLLCFSL